MAHDVLCFCCAALPFPGPEEGFDLKPLAAIVQETIFAQLLRLPESELGVLAYAKVTVSFLQALSRPAVLL